MSASLYEPESPRRTDGQPSLPVISGGTSEPHRVRAADREHRIKPPVDPSTLHHRELLAVISGAASQPTATSTRPRSSTTAGR